MITGRRRVAVTGLGVVTCLGSDVEQFWQALLKGESGVRRINTFDTSDLPCQIAGQIQDFEDQLLVGNALASGCKSGVSGRVSSLNFDKIATCHFTSS